MYTVKEIHSKKDIKEFVKFPFSIFKGNSQWVPPIIKEEIDFFDATKNPVFKTSDVWFYLAYNEDSKVVGRIAVIINHIEINQQNVKKVRFGWLDMIDDLEVTRQLLQKAIEKAQELEFDYIEGPMGFSNMDKVGVMTEGFQYVGNMATWYSMPYYKKHLETLGMAQEKKFVEMYFTMENITSESFGRTAQLVKKRYGVRVVPTETTNDIMNYVDKMFDLFNESYAKLSSFVPVNKSQREYFKKKYVPFLNPEYIKFIEDASGQLICFAIVLPSFSKALQKANGKLFPFGFLHLLKAKKKNDTVDFYLIGVAPEYQRKGIPALLFDSYYSVFKKNNVRKCIITPELEDNIAIQQLWKNFNPKIHIKRATYRLNFQ